jgi:hypothetical protein
MANIDMRTAYELLKRAIENQTVQRPRSGEPSLSGAPARDGDSHSSPQGGGSNDFVSWKAGMINGSRLCRPKLRHRGREIRTSDNFLGSRQPSGR